MRKYVFVCTFLAASVSPMFSQSPVAETDPNFQQQLHAAREATMAGKFNEAVDAFKRLNKLQNDSCAVCYVGMAVAYQRMSEFENAIKSCNRALAVANNDQIKASAHSMKGTAILGLGGSDGKNFKNAEAEYRTATELDKNEPVFRLNLATVLLRESKDEEGKDELNKCLALHPAPSIAQQASRLIENPRLARENFAPDFHVTTLQGKDISLSQLRGNIVVLDFWATWCPPCRASVSELKDLTRKYSNAKVVLISISGDKDEQAWREFVAKKNMDWPQYRDTNDSVMNSFDVHAFPTYVVIDGEGVIKERIRGMDPQERIVHRLKATLRDLPQLEGLASK